MALPGGVDRAGQVHHQPMLGAKSCRGRRRPRIGTHSERLSILPARDRQPDRIGARQSQRPLGRRRGEPRIGTDLESVGKRGWRVVPKIPVDPIGSHSDRKPGGRRHPEIRMRRSGRFHNRCNRRARQMPHGSARAIHHVDGNLPGGRGPEPVVDQRAIGWIERVRHLGRKRRGRIHVAPEPDRVARLKQVSRLGRDSGRQLPEHREIVEHPDPSSVGADDQVVALDGDVPIRCVRQIQGERLPVVPIVEGDLDAALGSREQQPPLDRIGPDHPRHAAADFVCRQAGDDLRPGPAEIPGPVEVRRVVAQPDEFNGGIGGARLPRRRFDARDVRPAGIGQPGDAHVSPGFAFVPREMNEAVAGPDPDGTAGHSRRGNGLNGTLAPGGDGRSGRVEAAGNAEVRTPTGPVRAAIRGRHQEVEAGEQLPRIPRRPDQRL